MWLRFFDSRLHDIRKLSGGDFAVPYLLGFKSERGRNYGRVFRQLETELSRLRRTDGRRLVVYVITHGQCHLPPELVEKLAGHAFLYGIIILPSSAVRLDWLPLLQRSQIVDAAALKSRESRRSRALDILADAGADSHQRGTVAASGRGGPDPRPGGGAAASVRAALDE